MEIIIPVVIVLAVIAFAWGRAADSSLAKKIGREVNVPAPSDDPVLLLEKLNQLREAGAVTEAEYEAQKARILEDR